MYSLLRNPLRNSLFLDMLPESVKSDCLRLKLVEISPWTPRNNCWSRGLHHGRAKKRHQGGSSEGALNND